MQDSAMIDFVLKIGHNLTLDANSFGLEGRVQFKQSIIYYNKTSRGDFVLIDDEEKFVLVAGNYTCYAQVGIILQRLKPLHQIEAETIIDLSRQFNGIYVIISFFKKSKVWQIITDPLGMMPVYFYNSDNMIVISSKIRYIKDITVPLSWNKEAIRIYRSNGHFMFGDCWYNEISKIKAATVKEISTEDLIFFQSRYWSWEKIPLFKGNEKEAIDMYHQKFVAGIMGVSTGTKPAAVSLSGGLDSRYILSVAKAFHHIEAFSFSVANSRDLNIARKLCELSDTRHHWYQLKERASLSDRLPAFMLADGMLHAGHIHEAEIHHFIKEAFPIYFHGFYGGGIYAGNAELNKRINEGIAGKYFFTGVHDTQYEDDFYNIESIDAYFVDQKIRNESAHSLQILGHLSQVIVPFYNMDWIEFNYSLPESWQIYQKLYLKVLAKKLQFGFADVSWQKTMVPVNQIGLNEWMLKLKKASVEDRLFQLLGRSIHFTNPLRLSNEEKEFVVEFFKQHQDIERLSNRTKPLQEIIDYSIAYYMTEMRAGII